jgi:LemA protein
MNAITKIVLALVAIAAIFGMMLYGMYSNLVVKQSEAQTAWSNVETQYQRRADLIPRMVNVANASMQFQTKLTTEYAKEREGLGASERMYREALDKVKMNDPKSIENAEAAWRDVQSKWNNVGLTINARTESVPQAQLDQLTELNNEMAALESVISGKRELYNNAVMNYNNYLRIPPASWFANGWGFDRMEQFKAQVGAENAPLVNLNI